jgi:hypothetical protein
MAALFEMLRKTAKQYYFHHASGSWKYLNPDSPHVKGALASGLLSSKAYIDGQHLTYGEWQHHQAMNTPPSSGPGSPDDPDFNAQHPRVPAGSPKGGEFAPKGGGAPTLSLKPDLPDPPTHLSTDKSVHARLLKMKAAAEQSRQMLHDTPTMKLEEALTPVNAAKVAEFRKAEVYYRQQVKDYLAKYQAASQQYDVAHGALNVTAGADSLVPDWHTKPTNLEGMWYETTAMKDAKVAFDTKAKLALIPEPIPPVMPGGTTVKAIWEKNKVFELQSKSAGKNALQNLLAVSNQKKMHGPLKQYYQELLAYHTALEQGGKAAPQSGLTPDVITFTPKTGPASKLAEAVQAKKPKVLPPLPEPPQADTSGKYKPEDIALFHKKIAMLQQAALGKNPLSAVDAVPAGASVINAYKAKIIGWIEVNTEVPDAIVGDTLSTYQLVGEVGAIPEWKAYPHGSNSMFNAGSAAYRQQLPSQQGYALGNYKGSGYHALNAHRFNPGAKLPTDHVYLDKALAGYAIDRNVLLRRNIGSPVLAKIAPSLVGKVVEDPAYMSTSLDGGFGSERNVHIYLNAPKGTLGVHYSSEHEWILPRKTRWLVHKVEKDGTGAGSTRIYATILPPNQQEGIPK